MLKFQRIITDMRNLNTKIRFSPQIRLFSKPSFKKSPVMSEIEYKNVLQRIHELTDQHGQHYPASQGNLFDVKQLQVSWDAKLNPKVTGHLFRIVFLYDHRYFKIDYPKDANTPRIVS